jgi:hypothetical protein
MKGYDGATHSALMVIEKKLITAKEMVYPRLRTTKSRRMHSADAASLGQQMGKNLNINPAISKATQTGLYLR